MAVKESGLYQGDRCGTQRSRELAAGAFVACARLHTCTLLSRHPTLARENPGMELARLHQSCPEFYVRTAVIDRNHGSETGC